MAKFIDRRAGSPDRIVTKDEASEDQLASARRRIEKGARTAQDFFDPLKFEKAVTRRDLLNVLSMVEYARRESSAWRRLGRWVRGINQPAFTPGRLAKAHAFTLNQIQAAMELDKYAKDEAAKAEKAEKAV